MRLEAVPSLAAVQEEWGALAERSGNLFATPEWLATWWRHFGTDRPLALHLLRAEDGTPAAAVALYHAAGRPLRTLRFVGHDVGDVLGPVHPPGREDLGLAVLTGALEAESGSWDVLLAEHVPRAAGLVTPTEGVELAVEGSPEIVVAGRSWDDLLAARSANFRGQVRRRARRLAREHAVRYRLCDDPARLPGDLDTLLRLHAARWGPTGQDALAPRAAFHREFAALALERGWLRLWILEADDRPVAAWYGFRFAGDEWYYQAGRDPAWEHESVGFVLLAHTVRAAVEDGVRAYRFLRGDEPYKSRWADHDPGLHTFVAGAGVRGRAAMGALAGARRLPPAASRRLMRLAARGAGVRA